MGMGKQRVDVHVLVELDGGRHRYVRRPAGRTSCGLKKALVCISFSGGCLAKIMPTLERSLTSLPWWCSESGTGCWHRLVPASLYRVERPWRSFLGSRRKSVSSSSMTVHSFRFASGAGAAARI